MDIREQTFEELINNLNKYGKTALVRSTGFGKTFMLTKLIQRYNNVLFLYPTKVIMNTVLRYSNNNLPNVTFMTYMKLIKLTDKEIKNMNYDLIICDEVHRVGADKTKTAIGKLFKYHPNSHFVGSTATPNRSDAFDIIDTFFENINVSEYTLHDSFQDGILKKPYYIYFAYERGQQVGQDIKRLTDTETITFTPAEKEMLKKSALEIANLYNIEYVIKNVINECVKDKSYMKFICFFNGIEHVNTKGKEVKTWFEHSFPNHQVNTLVITSENDETTKNVDELENMERKENTIDLIYCIDMLNMGYHVSDITGVLMYRCTSSNIIYIQQLGRALSSGENSNSALIFDIVDNIKRGSLFDTYDRNTIEMSVRERKIQEEIANGTYTGTHIEIIDNKPTEISNDYYYNKETKQITKKWWRFANNLQPEDLSGTGVMASYRELLRKAVAEPMLQRCKIAFASHFRYWCHENNIPFPITDKELREVYGYEKSEFNNYFYNLVKNNEFNYPLGDAELLKREGLDLIAQIWDLTADKIVEALWTIH